MDSSLKSKKSRSDTAVQGTNDSSIVSKCSMSQLGYFKDDFLQYFVAKKTRRSPLINRGYYIRAKALDYVLKMFLNTYPEDNKQIVSLGAGFDSAYFRLKSEGMIQENTVFVEIDFIDVMQRKFTLIQQSTALKELIGEMELRSSDPVLEKHVVLRSGEYILVGVDLTDLRALTACMRELGISPHTHTLLLSEVVLTYMTPQSSNQVISWAADYFERGVFAAYEQVYPQDGFGKVMMSHFKKLGSPLRSIGSFPTPASQAHRYKELGWDSSMVVDMNFFYNNKLDTEEKERIQKLEPFDEHEEWHLKCMHYVLITAFQAGTAGLKEAMWVNMKRELSSDRATCHSDNVVPQLNNAGVMKLEVAKSGEKALLRVESDYMNGAFCSASYAEPTSSEIFEIMDCVGHNSNVLKLQNVCETKDCKRLRGLKRFGHRMCGFNGGRFVIIGGFGENEKRHSRFKDITFVDYNLESSCDSQEHPHELDHSEMNIHINVESVKIGMVTKDFKTGEGAGITRKNIPTERLFHSLVKYKSGRLLLFGGRISPLLPLADLVEIVSNQTSHDNVCGRDECKASMGDTHSNDGTKSCHNHRLQPKSRSEYNIKDNNYVGESTCEHLKSANVDMEEITQTMFQCVTRATSGRDSPCERWRHVACGIELEGKEYMWLHGGVTLNNQVLGDCFLLDIHTFTWNKMSVQGAEMGSLHSHSIAVQNNTIFLSGGLEKDGLPSNNVFSVNVSRNTEKQSFEMSVNHLTLQSDLVPRYSHTSAIVKEHLILVGGVSFHYPTPDVTVITLSNGRMKNAYFEGGSLAEPLLLHNHQMTVTKKSELLILGGGGNCFSFGTHLNSMVYSVDVTPLLDDTEHL